MHSHTLKNALKLFSAHDAPPDPSLLDTPSQFSSPSTPTASRLDT